jgi:hypothetical protein
MIEMRQLYRSASGDRWSLAHEPGSATPFILHEPNLPSGGRTTRLEIATFLARGEDPEQQELFRLMQTLIEERADT